MTEYTTKVAGLTRKLAIAVLNGHNALRDNDSQGASDVLVVIDRIKPHQTMLHEIWRALAVDSLLRELEEEASRLVI